MTETLYRLRIANGNEYGPSTAADICASIRAGRIAENSQVAEAPFTQYVSITAVAVFYQAFAELRQAAAPQISSPTPAPSEAPPEPQSERPKTVEDFLFDNSEIERAKSFHPLANSTVGREISAAEEAIEQQQPEEEAPNDEVATYLKERAQYDEGVRDLEEGRYTEARTKFDALAQAHPNTSEYVSSLAYTEFRLAQTDGHAAGAARKLKEIHEQYPYCVPTLLFLARATTKSGRAKTAIRYLKAALEIEPNRRDIELELQKTEDLASGKAPKNPSSGSNRLSSEQKSRSTSRSNSRFKSRPKSLRNKNRPRGPNAGRLASSLLIFGIVFAILFFMAVVSRMGEFEYFYDPGDNFFMIRRVLLLVLGVALSFAMLKDEGFGKKDIFCNPAWIVFGLAFGGLVGYLSPPQAVKSTLGVVIALTIFHVIAEEAFFRVFLARNLALGLPGVWLPSLVGGLLFGLYHMTYYSFAANPMEVVDFASVKPSVEGAIVDLNPTYEKMSIGLTSSIQAWQSVGLISIGSGVPLYYLYYKSRSILPPLICHLAMNITMMILSYDALKL